MSSTVLPKLTDVYDPSDPWLGNTNLKDLFPDGKCE
jgi:sodium/potassium-transporting ATPase subunit alpha